MNSLVASYVNGGNATYFDSFGVKRIIKKKKKFTRKKIIITNIIEYK